MLNLAWKILRDAVITAVVAAALAYCLYGWIADGLAGMSHR